MKSTVTRQKQWGILLAGAIAATTLTGCGNKGGNDEVDLSGAAKKVGNTVETTVKKAAPKVKKAAKEAAQAGRAGLSTAKIKTAIITHSGMKGAVINVDTIDHKVALRGRVRSARQKQLAAQIAKREAPGYAVVNQLKVVGS